MLFQNEVEAETNSGSLLVQPESAASCAPAVEQEYGLKPVPLDSPTPNKAVPPAFVKTTLVTVLVEA